MDPALERDIIQRELEYRRMRRWQIFTWANTILLAITGGVIALQLQTGATLSLPQKAVATVAVAVFGGYCASWWHAQRNIGVSLGQALEKIDRALGITIPDDKGSIPDRIGGGIMILLLAVAAIAAIWLPAS